MIDWALTFVGTKIRRGGVRSRSPALARVQVEGHRLQDYSLELYACEVCGKLECNHAEWVAARSASPRPSPCIPAISRTRHNTPKQQTEPGGLSKGKTAMWIEPARSIVASQAVRTVHGCTTSADFEN
jgi:hypothetical protein